MFRESGILFPVSSLPSRFGIGCFSREAYEFVDFLRDADYFSQRDIDKLLRMNKYKAEFRASNKVKKILLSLRNMDIFLANVFYKIKTKTPMGFNR